MKNYAPLLLVILLGVFFQLLLPWYTVALAGFVALLIADGRTAGRAFAFGLLGGALLWGSYSSYLNWQNEGLMASRLGTALGGLSPLVMVLVTALLGGLYAGLGALCGYWGRQLFKSGNQKTTVQ